MYIYLCVQYCMFLNDIFRQRKPTRTPGSSLFCVDTPLVSVDVLGKLLGSDSGAGLTRDLFFTSVDKTEGKRSLDTDVWS